MKTANPTDYRRMLSGIKPGDRLMLAAGLYPEGLVLEGVRGTAHAPIVIEGPPDEAARFPARRNRNVVSLRSSSHIVLRNLLIELGDESVDAVKADGAGAGVHHIVLENLTIVGRAADQQSVGISTKAPAAHWRIRNNFIIGVGTGLYLGDSDGSAPFVAGIIEGNVIVSTLGYSLQIKHQISREGLEATDADRRETVIRGNYFSKAVGSSAGAAARPSVLIGHLPPSGEGAEDRYLVSGNVFFANPAEALFQGEGNVTLRSNLFLNPTGPGINLLPHNAVPRRVEIVGNFVVTAGRPIYIEGVHPGFSPIVTLNRVHRIGRLSGRDYAAEIAADWIDYWPALADIGGPDRTAELRGALRLACGASSHGYARVPKAALIPSDNFSCSAVGR